jgi:hypothetical protein
MGAVRAFRAVHQVGKRQIQQGLHAGERPGLGNGIPQP